MLSWIANRCPQLDMYETIPTPPARIPENTPTPADIVYMRTKQNKTVRFNGDDAARERNQFQVSKMKKPFTEKFIRDCSSFEHRLNGEFFQHPACLKMSCDCQLRKGLITTHGANVHYVFVPRVNQQEIDKAIDDINQMVITGTTQQVTVVVNGGNVRRNRLITDNDIQSRILPIMQKVKGMWYLQDIYDFLTKIHSRWGDNWLVLLRPIFDVGNDVNPDKRDDANVVGGANPQTPPKSVHDVDYWGNTLRPTPLQEKRRKYFWPATFMQSKTVKWGRGNPQQTNGNTREYFLVYDYIIEPWMAAMLNMHQAIINNTKWHCSPATHINEFNKKITKFKRMYFRHQLGLQNRASLRTIQPMVNGGNL